MDLFDKYKKQRNDTYGRLFKATFILVDCFLTVLMVFMCIFFGSAKPLWLMLLIVPLVLLSLYKCSTEQINKITKDDQELYYHDGGLFFVSYAQFLDEEKRISDNRI